MAVTRTKSYRPGQVVNVAKFTATADNDVLMAAGTAKLIIGAFFGSHLTALNIADSDISAYPAPISTVQAVSATSDGTSDDVTIVWVEIPATGMTTYSN
jgi:hypothetical protein